MAFLVLPGDLATSLLEETCLPTTNHRCFGRSMFLIGGAENLFGKEVSLYVGKELTVATFAFLGAYLFAIRSLLKSVANFDLSPLTFFRLGLHILTACIVSIVLWRGLEASSEIVPISLAKALNPAWFVLAFVIGWVPDLGLIRLLRAIRIRLIKSVNTAAIQATSITPLELIDGIDQDVRFRLEEHNLYDVQNLATANPILLFVETPYGIYQSIDWVAQAQLATNVGVPAPRAWRSLRCR